MTRSHARTLSFANEQRRADHSTTANTVVIAAGSNMDAEKNVPLALARLEISTALCLRAVSTVLETEAVGPDGLPSGQAAFHNLAIWAETTLTRKALEQHLRQIEHELGRRRTADKFAPRPIDLDIAIFCPIDAIIDAIDDNLIFVADDVATAYHVAAPIARILPDWIHPRCRRSMREIVRRLTSNNQS